MTVSFLSVGQGDAVLITTPSNRNILIDGGPDQTILTRLGQSLPWYKRHLNMIILTHNHDDHLQGLLAVLKKYKVDQFLLSPLADPLPNSLSESLISHQVPDYVLEAGRVIDLGDGIKLKSLWPESGQIIAEQNDRSLILELSYGDRKFLLSGDAGLAVEKELMKKKTVQQVDVYKLSHHASDTANSQEYLDLIKPKFAVVEVGIDNRLGHPNRRILKRIERIGAKLLRTDWDGNIVFKTDGKELSYELIK